MYLTSDSRDEIAGATPLARERAVPVQLEGTAWTRDSRGIAKAQLDAELNAVRRAVLLVNRRSRRGKQFYRDATRLLAASGIELDPKYSALTGSRLSTLISDAIADGHRLIIVGGGDGTLSKVLPHFVYRDVALGILPLGTANSFARCLGIPLDLQSAVNVITSGKVVDVDVGRIGEAYFCTVASVGLAAKIARHMPPRLKKWLGRLAYPLVALAQLRRFAGFRCTVTANGQSTTVDAVEVRVANAAYQGGVEVVREANAESRDLVAHITTGSSIRKLLSVWLRLTAGVRPDPDEVKTIRSRRFTIDAVPRQYVAIDGEAFIRTPLEVSVAEQALFVVVPSDQDHLE
jgi:YegS/Rv2252/BmrU family lipid kinase